METVKETVLGEGRKVVRCGGEENIFLIRTRFGGEDGRGITYRLFALILIHRADSSRPKPAYFSVGTC